MWKKGDELWLNRLAETGDEGWSSCEVKIKDLIKNKFGIQNDLIRKRAHLIGKVNKSDLSQKYQVTIIPNS